MGQRKRKQQESNCIIEQDERFYFIAGYTENGVPYGVTWEEQEEIEQTTKEYMFKEKGDPVELRMTERQLSELVQTYDFHLEGFRSYLNVETYLAIPESESWQGCETMQDFADTVNDQRLQDRLYQSLNGGRGVFRRFKDVLASSRDETERY